MKIFKYDLHITDDKSEIFMPEGAEILSAHAIGDTVSIWVKFDHNVIELTPRYFMTCPTGYTITPVGKLNFIDTVVMNEGRLIFHIFEVA